MVKYITKWFLSSYLYERQSKTIQYKCTHAIAALTTHTYYNYIPLLL